MFKRKSVEMKSFVIFAFILAIASGHRQRIEWGLHQLHAYVPAKGNEVVEYTIQYPYSVSHHFHFEYIVFEIIHQT